jgi:Tol biopolymer transport system component
MKAAPEGRRNRAVNLTKCSATDDEQPAWSPDGRKIGFTSSLADPIQSLAYEIENTYLPGDRADKGQISTC